MASTAFLAQGVVFNIGTTAGSAKTITGVTLGNPTIILATAHGFNNGDTITIASVTGTTVVNGVWVATNKTANTFAIQLDTTGGTAYVSGGTATPLLLQTIRNVRGNITFMDGQAAEIDVTNMASTAKEYVLGLIDSGNCKFEVDIDDSDLGQQAILTAQQSAVKKTFKIVMPSGSTPNFTFTGFVRQFTRDMAPDGVFKGTVDIRITAPVTLS